MVEDELLVHSSHDGDGIAINGPDVALRPKAAESMSLALHELTTNAVKHGALANHNGGKIAIGWQLNGNGEKRLLNFEWAEKGSKGGVAEPSRHGFGMELLTRILPYDLGGKTSVEFLKGGLRFTMDMPIENVVDS